MISDRLDSISIVDVLTDVERWVDLLKYFKHVSDTQSRMEDLRSRLLAAIFCYGCNLGPLQTERSLQGSSRKQNAWINIKYVNEESLDKAITAVINQYNKFELPRFWGEGRHASADGTKFNLYEQNLLSEYHIRYGGYGGIGYYHVSDKYIALFSHFISCGTYEGVHILDGLMTNSSDIQPDTLHGDTQAQNFAVFGLAHLLGIKLMPRIRGIKDLNFYRPQSRSKYKHIDSLFGDPIDWKLIERHHSELMRIAVSVKMGKIAPSTILRRVGSNNRKNKTFAAFQELGKAVRTEFLLDYINSLEIRQMIHRETNKSEQFNAFLKCSFFGSEGIIRENLRHEQRKIIKYNHLVANMVILHIVQSMTHVINQLRQEGYPVTESLLRSIAPLRPGHINRFGRYHIDMRRRVAPMDFHVEVVRVEKLVRLVG